MSTVDELERLQQLYASGALTDEEFARAKARILHGGPGAPRVGQLHRRRHGAWLAGVCSGLARFSGVHVAVWRVAFLFFLPAAGVSVLLYTLMALLVPIEH